MFPDDPAGIIRVHHARDEEVIDLPIEYSAVGACRLHHQRQPIGRDHIQEFAEVLLRHVQGAREHQGIGPARHDILDRARREAFIRVKLRYVCPGLPVCMHGLSLHVADVVVESRLRDADDR